MVQQGNHDIALRGGGHCRRICFMIPVCAVTIAPQPGLGGVGCSLRQPPCRRGVSLIQQCHARLPPYCDAILCSAAATAVPIPPEMHLVKRGLHCCCAECTPATAPPVWQSPSNRSAALEAAQLDSDDSHRRGERQAVPDRRRSVGGLGVGSPGVGVLGDFS